MFTQSTEPGCRAMKISGEVEDIWVAAVKSKPEMSVFVLNRVKGEKQVTVAGFPPNRPLKSWMWNADGTGTLTQGPPVTADRAGTVTVKVPNMAIELLSPD